MAKPPPEDPNRRESLAREVDRLLRQLPGADPSLKGESPPAPPSLTRPGMPPRPATAPTQRDAAPVPLVVWGRLALGILLGVAFTAWPYGRDCGFPLYGYLAAVFVLLVTAGWAAVGAWQRRMAVAHILALILAFWGIVLAAEQILPRIGYAADAATWSCAPAGAIAPPRRPPPSEAPTSPPEAPTSPPATGAAPQSDF